MQKRKTKGMWKTVLPEENKNRRKITARKLKRTTGKETGKQQNTVKQKFKRKLKKD